MDRRGSFWPQVSVQKTDANLGHRALGEPTHSKTANEWGTRQNEGNHNSQKATLRRAGCPGGSSSITRPIKPRTHPGLEKRETWGTHSYLILLPKIKDGSGQETRATRPSPFCYPHE